MSKDEFAKQSLKKLDEIDRNFLLLQEDMRKLEETIDKCIKARSLYVGR